MISNGSCYILHFKKLTEQHFKSSGGSQTNAVSLNSSLAFFYYGQLGYPDVHTIKVFKNDSKIFSKHIFRG